MKIIVQKKKIEIKLKKKLKSNYKKKKLWKKKPISRYVSRERYRDISIIDVSMNRATPSQQPTKMTQLDTNVNKMYPPLNTHHLLLNSCLVLVACLLQCFSLSLQRWYPLGENPLRLTALLPLLLQFSLHSSVLTDQHVVSTINCGEYE